MPSSWPSSVSATPGAKRSSVDLAGRVLLDQRARAALGDDLRLVHDDEAVAQLLGLVHVVGGQDQRHAALLEPVQPVPEQVPGLRVEAGRRLVEEEQVGSLMSDRAIVRRRFIPPDSGSTWSLARSVSWANSSSSSARSRDLRPRQAEVAPVDRAGSRGRSARCRACPAAGRRRAARGSAGRRVAGSMPMTASVPPSIGETQPIIRIVEVLPAPFGPRNPNDSPGATSKSMASTAVKSPKRLVRPRAWMSAGSEDREDASGAGAPDRSTVSGMGAHGTASSGWTKRATVR